MNLDKFPPPENPEDIIAFLNAVIADREDFTGVEKVAVVSGYVVGVGFAMQMIAADRRAELASELFDRLLELNGLIEAL